MEVAGTSLVARDGVGIAGGAGATAFWHVASHSTLPTETIGMRALLSTIVPPRWVLKGN